MTSSSLGVSNTGIRVPLTATIRALFSAAILHCGAVLSGRAWRRALAVCAVLLALPATLMAQNDAYSVEVAVADRSAVEQQHAYQAAFRRVLLNNSGDKTLLNRDDIRAGLKSAEQYVAAYSYRAPPPGTVIESDTPLTDEVRRTGQATQLMLVSFDRESVDLLIEGPIDADDQGADEAESRVLSTDSALVWLLVQDDGRDIMISDPAAVNVQARAREIVGAAGVSLVFPSGDEEDNAALGLEDLLVSDLDRIRAASARYGQDTILIGTLARNGAQGWSGNWTRLLGEEQTQTQSFDTSSLDDALQSGLSLLGEQGSLDETYRYGGSATSDTEVLVWVGSIDSTADYSDMMKFFEALPAVRTVYPKEVSDTSVVFALLPRSSLTDIESAVVSQSWLRRAAPPVTDMPDSLSRNADLVLEFGR